jgi:carboxypeptidase C (cathepsin A)
LAYYDFLTKTSILHELLKIASFIFDTGLVWIFQYLKQQSEPYDSAMSSTISMTFSMVFGFLKYTLDWQNDQNEAKLSKIESNSFPDLCHKKNDRKTVSRYSVK